MRKLAVLWFGVLAAWCCVSCGFAKETAAEKKPEPLPGLAFVERMETVCAQKFSVDYYEDDYALITIADAERFLLVPEGREAPEGLDKNIVPLFQPLNQICLSASAVMDMFVALNALDQIRFSSLKAEGWYIDEARAAMEAGEIVYAGKYSAPDYERLISEGCGLAIENTMIYHTPEVKERLERFGIPVMVDYSSYEPDPLGRTEWVKLYGLLAGREQEAEEAFNAQMEAFLSVDGEKRTNKTAAFFYITTNGEANIRKPSDYLPKMIELAGGSYLPQLPGRDENAVSSTMTMQMEEFYASAKDADYLIYNSTIEGELSSIKELTGKSRLLEKFRAVQEGNVFCTTKNLYQSSMELGTLIQDIHKLLTGEEEGLTYLYKLEE